MHYTSVLIASWAAVAMGVPTGSKFVVRQYANSSDSTTTGEKSPGLLFINGEPAYIDGQPVASFGPGVDSLMAPGTESVSAGSGQKLCDVTVDDVLTCATNKRNTLIDPDNAVKKDVLSTFTGGYDGAYLQLEYDSHFSECTVSDPKFISKEPLIACGMDTCSETFTWQEATTDTNTYGIKMSSKQTVSFNEAIVKASIEFGEEFTDSWTHTDVVTTTRSTTRTMKLGNMCAWSNIQFFVDCKAQLSVNRFSVHMPDASLKYGWLENICTNFATEPDRTAFIRGQGFPEPVVQQVNEVCDESTVKTDDQGLVRLDLGDGTMSNAKPWSIQGCMYN